MILKETTRLQSVTWRKCTPHIASRYFILLARALCQHREAFLVRPNSQETLAARPAGAGAAARAGEQRPLPVLSRWFWWQVFGIIGRSPEPRDHGRTSLFLFLWSVGLFNNFMLPFLIEQSGVAFVVRPFLGFSEYYITEPYLSVYKDVSYFIYQKTRGKVHITPPLPWLFWHEGNRR